MDEYFFQFKNALVLFDDYTFGYIHMDGKKVFHAHRPFLFCANYVDGNMFFFTGEPDPLNFDNHVIITSVRAIEVDLQINPNIKSIQKNMFRPQGSYALYYPPVLMDSL